MSFSSLLFILYTSDYKSIHPNRRLIKFADGTAVLPLLRGSEKDHGPAPHDFLEWCDNALLELNVVETKEMVIDFQRNTTELDPVVIHGQEVDLVDQYKYLGTIFDNTLRFEENTEARITKSTPTSIFPQETEHIQCP